MLDDFFVRALLAGIGVALVTGPLGCFVVWRRMAYFGDTMSHAALLGVALAFLVDVNVLVGVFGVTVAGALLLVTAERRLQLSTDVLLGILAHGTLACGLVLVALLPGVRIDLMAYLFGDILAVGQGDLLAIFLGGAAVLGILSRIWTALLAATVNEELAAAEHLDPARARLVFMVLLAAIIAIAMKIVGILLITAMLVIPAATARRIASGPEQMALMAAGAGVGAVLLGLGGSLRYDTPAGPSVVVAALAIFVAVLGVHAARRMFAALEDVAHEGE